MLRSAETIKTGKIFSATMLCERRGSDRGWNGAFAEKLFHHFVVAFGDHLDEFS